MIKGLVSIIIPSYNRYEQVQESIDSVLGQTVDLEIIVVDDCSTDKRYEKLDEIYVDKPVTIIHLPINMRIKHEFKVAQGLVRNEGMSVAKGEWFAFLDDDDKYIKEYKLDIQLYYMKKYSCLMSSTNMLINGNTPYFTGLFKSGVQLESDIYKLCLEDISQNNYINNSSVIIHRDIIDKIGQFYLMAREDYNYWQRAMKFTDCIYMHQPLVYYDLNSAKYYK